MKGYKMQPRSAEHCLKISELKKGKAFSENHKLKLRIARNNRSPEVSKSQGVRLSINSKTNPNYGMRGKHHSGETIKKVLNSVGYKNKRSASECLRKRYASGEIVPWNKGKKGLQVAWNKGKPWSEEIKTKILKSKFKTPSSFELKIIRLIEKHGLPYKYVGDGQVWINRKNPDFINTNGQKILIETYYSKYHITNYEESRIKTFSPYGFKVIFIDEMDLLSPNWELTCLSKIKECSPCA